MQDIKLYFKERQSLHFYFMTTDKRSGDRDTLSKDAKPCCKRMGVNPNEGMKACQNLGIQAHNLIPRGEFLRW
jgi:hypothetical protein